MHEPIDESYFVWLYSQVGSVRAKNPARTHWDLLRQLHQTEMIWTIPNDDNRLADGVDLRYEFLLDPTSRAAVPYEWMHMPCSFLEMLIAMSRRLAFEDGGEPAWWFWHMLENMGLHRCNDRNTRQLAYQINFLVQRVINREYEYNGDGGLFPLKHPRMDQRKVELWSQLNAYLLERMGEEV